MHKQHLSFPPQVNRYKKGFTLIEIMITIAIIGIITASAWPSFERYQQKNRRTDGISALLQNSAQLEKCFLNNSSTNIGTYVGCAITTPSTKNYYDIAGALGAETYSLTATAKGLQASDGDCVTLTLTNLGKKGSSGDGKVKRCWSQ